MCKDEPNAAPTLCSSYITTHCLRTNLRFSSFASPSLSGFFLFPSLFPPTLLHCFSTFFCRSRGMDQNIKAGRTWVPGCVLKHTWLLSSSPPSAGCCCSLASVFLCSSKAVVVVKWISGGHGTSVLCQQKYLGKIGHLLQQLTVRRLTCY